MHLIYNRTDILITSGTVLCSMRLIMNSIVRRINELRTNKGLSQNKFAKMIGVSANTVYHWNKTDAMPSLANIDRICSVFEITVEQFFHGMSEPQSDKDTMNFLIAWRSLSPAEKEAISKVISAFQSIREGQA